MKRTIVGLFKSFNQAEIAIKEIESDGLANNQISFVVKNSKNNNTNEGISDLDSVLVISEDVKIKDIGPVLSGGPLAGAIKQEDKDLIESLSYYGIDPETANNLNDYVAQGYTLVVIETDNSKVNQTANILNHFGAHRVEKWSISIEKPLLPHN